MEVDRGRLICELLGRPCLDVSDGGVLIKFSR